MDVEELARSYDGVVDLELERLHRRQPGLTATELAVVRATLTDLLDRLLLDTARRDPARLRAARRLFTVAA